MAEEKKGIVEQATDWFRKILEDYTVNSEQAKQRRDTQKATVYNEREERKKKGESTGSSFGVYE